MASAKFESNALKPLKTVEKFTVITFYCVNRSKIKTLTFS